MIFVDSDVFLIDIRYAQDRRFDANARFLQRLRARGDGMTTIFNVLEICGVLSFNLNSRQLMELYAYLPVQYKIGVVPSHGPAAATPRLPAAALLRVMRQRASLGDAQVIALLRTMQPTPDLLVTWNTVHFAGRLEGTLRTPADALRAL